MISECKKMSTAFPRYKLNKLSPKERFVLLQRSIQIDMPGYDSKWYQTLIGHHYNDMKKINQRKNDEEKMTKLFKEKQKLDKKIANILEK